MGVRAGVGVGVRVRAGAGLGVRAGVGARAGVHLLPRVLLRPSVRAISLISLAISPLEFGQRGRHG